MTDSEGFADNLLHMPGCFFRLGNGEASAMPHHPAYDFNDERLTVGAAFWTRPVERWLPAWGRRARAAPPRAALPSPVAMKRQPRR